MKEKPIIFSGPMVRAILEGRKTQTRRVVKSETVQLSRYGSFSSAETAVIQQKQCLLRSCPYEKGMRLWVRETWLAQPSRNSTCGQAMRGSKLETRYRADDGWEDHPSGSCIVGRGYRIDYNEIVYPPEKYGIWRPSIFMPRWASRILLEVEDVRVERVHDISESDAKAEGASCVLWYEPCGNPDAAVNLSADAINPVHPSHAKGHDGICYRNGFATLWDSINGKKPGRAWADNPFVWVVQFRRIDT